MVPLKVKLTAFRDAGEEIFSQGKEKFAELIGPAKIEFVDLYPDVIFFLSGGSERSALSVVEKGGYYVMIASADGNSNASALEVKAALFRRGIDSLLLDAEDGQTKVFLNHLYQVKNALAKINGQQLGLIGEVSEWLVASEIKPEILNTKLGIKLKKLSWETLPDFQTMEAPEIFKSTFARGNGQDIEKAGQVFSLLQSTIENHQLDAVTVECFSLVKTRAVSGCLALAMLNHIGIPAACEGDIVSGTGMIIAKALTGKIPWLANVAKISYEKTLLAHCTIDPGLVSDFEIRTHFETGIGTAIQGEFTGDEITIFRLDDTLERIFTTTGKIINRPRYASACRTQIEIELPKEAVDSLRENPLGNHHLVLPGNHKDVIDLLGKILSLEPV
ncbi:hypothetical protein KJ966_03590 [bacterium]|nr:hypothetical protein [bacterium]